jgi:hypothetical protein
MIGLALRHRALMHPVIALLARRPSLARGIVTAVHRDRGRHQELLS